MKRQISEKIRKIFHLLFTAVPFRRVMIVLLSVLMIVTGFPVSAHADDTGYKVTFKNYDGSELTGDYTFEDVPEGAKLVSKNDLEDSNAIVDDADWYLYLEGEQSYGPRAIKNPPAREGYVFRDWAAAGADDDSIYTVTSDTVFMARYASTSQYVINLYYQFDNAEHSVAAETSTEPFGYGQTVSMALPSLDSLEGLSPIIKVEDQNQTVQNAVGKINEMINGNRFEGTVNEAFLDNCREAGFVDYNDEKDEYIVDDDGNIQIRIPITYSLTTTVSFKVSYRFQDADNPESYVTMAEYPDQKGEVTGTTRVSLSDMDMVIAVEGFELTAASKEDAESFSVNPNGSSTIILQYDRKIYNIYYQMNGGNARDPRQLRYGQTIPEDVTEAGTRPGYTFYSWSWFTRDETELPEVPVTMPSYDLTLSANWDGANTSVTLVYWLENANDPQYSVAGSIEITVRSGQTVGIIAGNSYDRPDVDISKYTTAEFMKESVGISDAEYFSYSYCDSSSAIPEGQSGSLKTAAGDGSTVINVGFTRNEYTLVFHLGKTETSQNWWGSTTYRYISTGGRSEGSLNSQDWNSGFGWSASIDNDPVLSIGGQEYHISNDKCYTITAKYGAFISDRWPVGTDDNIESARVNGKSYYLFTWGTHENSPYYKNHDSNTNIIGVYATMSSDLIINPSNPDVVHHLVAYWSEQKTTKKHHYLFQIVPGIEEDEFPITGMEKYQKTKVFDDKKAQFSDISGLHFYENNSVAVRTTAESKNQNGPEFAHVTLKYACYNGDDIYFFYTYDEYTITYHENNEDLSGTGQDAVLKKVKFHYIDDVPLSDRLIDQQTLNYEPEQKFVSSYGNTYSFGGWYTSGSTFTEEFKVNWDKFNPESSVDIYAYWIAPTFSITFRIPGGDLNQNTLNQFTEKGYHYERSESEENGESVVTYVVSNIPGGTPGDEIVTTRYGAESIYSLKFDGWTYLNAAGEEQQYLFDSSQLVTSDLVLTAQWQLEYTGVYNVRYLTEEMPKGGAEEILIDGKTYYSLKPSKMVFNVAVGSMVTEEAVAINGYLAEQGEISVMVTSTDPNNPQNIDFVYSKASGDITYYVHYVRDVGINYGRTAPPDNVIRLAEDKTVTVEEASLDGKTTVNELAEIIGGYTPKESWDQTFILSANQEGNHFYIYYVANEFMVDFQVTYHFMNSENQYSNDDENTFVLNIKDSLGKTIYASELVENYEEYLAAGSADGLEQFEQKMKGHVLDETLTEKFLILKNTNSQDTVNEYHIYLKNGTYTLRYYLNDSDDKYKASWNNADAFLTQDGSFFYENVIYPNAANKLKTHPERLAYTFAGWNTSADGTGQWYSEDSLNTASWYSENGMYKDIDLYAQWEKKMTVSFEVRGGKWTDTSDVFYNEGTKDSPKMKLFVEKGYTATVPQNPEMHDGEINYSFIGWTAIVPDSTEWKQLFSGDNRVDLAKFEEYRFDFSKPITEDITLYAVWDPDVSVINVRKTDTSGKPLEGAEFLLNKLQAKVEKIGEEYSFELEKDDDGKVQVDTSFPGITIISDSSGSTKFENLSAGYYLLTESSAPAGYAGLQGAVIVYVPYGEEEQTITCLSETDLSNVSIENDLITVENIIQYQVAITAPESLTLDYSPPDIIWNPESMQYEFVQGESGEWNVVSSDDQSSDIRIDNQSQSGKSVDVSVVLKYKDAYSYLINYTDLKNDQFNTSIQQDQKVITGTLESDGEATFSLEAFGTLPSDSKLPSEITEAGSITIVVTPHKDG